MRRLYETDGAVWAFDAEVLSCEECTGGFAVVLSETAFFPEGGGQACDTGEISGARVTDVQLHGDAVVHTVARAFAVGETVHGEIDRAQRFARMQNHTGEHLLSGILHSLFGYDNVGFHMSEGCVVFDVNGPLTAAQIAQVEEIANRAVYENRAVTISFPSGEADWRSKLEFTDGVRVVTIDGYDKCACCAPHLARTGEIGVIKILDHTPHKGGTRITAACGQNALRVYQKLHEDSRRLMKLFSAPSDRVVEAAEKLIGDFAEAQGEINALKARLAAAELEVVRVGGVTCGFLPEAGFDTLRTCANAMEDDLVALFSDTGEYIVRGADVRELTNRLNERFHGKGGGKQTFTQGKLTAAREEIVEFLQGE